LSRTHQLSKQGFNGSVGGGILTLLALLLFLALHKIIKVLAFGACEKIYCGYTGKGFTPPALLPHDLPSLPALLLETTLLY